MTIAEDIQKANAYVPQEVSSWGQVVADIATYWESLVIYETGNNTGQWLDWMRVPPGAPWCVYWCRKVYDRAREYAGTKYTIDWTPPPEGPTYYVPELYRRMVLAGLARDVPRIGDLAFARDMSHVGIVTSLVDANTIITIDGNWSSKVQPVTRKRNACLYAGF